MSVLFVLAFFQIGVDAGPVQSNCDGADITLSALPTGSPDHFLIEWEDGVAPGEFLVVNPLVSSLYRVFLTDMDTSMVYQDTTLVLVHPGDPDLMPDGMLDDLDWYFFFAGWAAPLVDDNWDPDGDGQVTILDWFYFCNFQRNPPNTPPSLEIGDAFTLRDDTVTIPFSMQDAEDEPSFHIAEQGEHGFASYVNNTLRYAPEEGFEGMDSFKVYVSDGHVRTLDRDVQVSVLPPDTWSDIYNDIFFTRCWACHIDAVSGGLSLATYELAQSGGDSGAGFIAGNPEQSPVYLRVANFSMPLGFDPLSTLEIERIRLWILKGALP